MDRKEVMSRGNTMVQIVSCPRRRRISGGLIAAADLGYTPTVTPENQPTALQRMRLTFAKQGSTRYISHLDLARALERALNRAGLPVAYTQGFNRRPRLSLAAALPLGYTSEAEIADVWLAAPVTSAQFMAHLAPKMPPGITLISAYEVPQGMPSLQQQLAESVYEVRCLQPIDETLLRARVAEILSAESLIREKHRAKGNRPQSFDLRPLIIDMTLVSDGDEGPRLQMRLVQTASKTGRPDDVLAALGLDPLDTHVHRVALRFAEDVLPAA